MNLTRRHALAVTAASVFLRRDRAYAREGATNSSSTGEAMHCNIVIVPDMVQLDITGPFEVLARAPGWTVDLVAATLDPVKTERGLRLLPKATRESCRQSDIIVIPGGAGVDLAMLDDEWLDYVR